MRGSVNIELIVHMTCDCVRKTVRRYQCSFEPDRSRLVVRQVHRAPKAQALIRIEGKIKENDGESRLCRSSLVSFATWESRLGMAIAKEKTALIPNTTLWRTYFGDRERCNAPYFEGFARNCTYFPISLKRTHLFHHGFLSCVETTNQKGGESLLEVIRVVRSRHIGSIVEKICYSIRQFSLQR